MVDNIHDYHSFSFVIYFYVFMDKTYQIIWADDEIDALLDENSKALISQHHVEIVKCYNAAMLEEKLRNTSHRIDAVIVDANFTAKDYTPSVETDVSGFRRARGLIGEYRHLPFYLYTQRGNLSDLVDEDELTYFKDNNAILFKGDNLSPLLDRIKNDVDKINSAEFQIDNQFKNELICCKIFDNHCNGDSYNIIRSLLIKNQENDLQNSEKHLNEFRTLFENMNTIAANFGIVPEKLSLNEFSKFLCRNKDSKYLVNEDILPKALYEILFYVIRLVQDGSHDSSDLQYKIRRYIRDTQDVLIIRSILFAVIEIITWFTRYVEEHPDKEENLKKYIRIEDANDDKPEGIIEQDEKGYCHIDNKYSVLIRNRELIGKKVKILNSKENTSSSTKKYYPLFVREEDLQLLE